MSDITNLLNADLTSVSTDYPVLPEDVYNVSITKMEAVKTKDGSKDLLEIVVSLDQPAKDREGKPVSAGHQVTDRFSLTPTDKYPVEKIQGRLKQIMESVQGKGASGAFGNPSDYNGQKVVVKLGVEIDATGQYPDKNRISRFIPKN